MNLIKKIGMTTLGLALSAGTIVGISKGKVSQALAADKTYSCGFEASEGFTAGSNYQSDVTDGPEGKEWSFHYGTVSTSSKISDSNSAAMRAYATKKDEFGSLQTEFSLECVKSVSYKAKAATSNSAKLLLNTFYSTDDGKSWIAVDEDKALTSSAASYSFSISGVAETKYRIKFAISSSSTFPSSSNAQMTIDDISIVYEPSGNVPLESISANPVSVISGLTSKVMVTFDPADATNTDLTYSITSGSTYASVDEDGVVTGLAEGKATLHIVPDDTTASAIDVEVTVSNYPAPEVVSAGKKYYIVSSFNSKNYELTGVEGNNGTSAEYATSPSGTFILTAEEGAIPNTISFKNGENYLAYQSGGGNNLYTSETKNAYSSWVIYTEDDVLVVRNAQDFTRVLSCNASNQKFNCYANLNQERVGFVEYQEGVPLVSFAIDSEIEVRVGLTNTINVTYNPTNASDKTLVWTSGDTDIATVSNGVVTGVSEGETTITASKQGLTSQTCTVKVVPVTKHAGTLTDPFTVEDAVSYAKAFPKNEAEFYVKGLVTKMVGTPSTDACSFWVGDNEEQISAATGAFEFYKLANIDADTLALIKKSVGATVIGHGVITLYNSTTAEFKQGCTMDYNSFIVASTYAKGFVDSIASICATTAANPSGAAPTELVNFFLGEKATQYAALEDVERAHISGEGSTAASATSIQKMLAVYDFCMAKYTGLNNFLDRSVSAAILLNRNNSSTIQSNTAVIIVVCCAVGSVTALGVLIVIKRHKSAIK